MSRENAAQTRVDETAEWHELTGVELLHVLGDDRQRLVGILARRAVAREVLTHSHHAAILQATGKGDGMTCHQLGAFTKGAVADNRIQGIVVHVKHRCEIHMDAHAAALTRNFAAIFIEQLVVIYCSQDQVTLEIRHLLESHAQSPLAVDRDHERYEGKRLCQIGDLGLLGYSAFLIDESANKVLADQTLHCLACLFFARWRDCRHDELPNAGFGRHAVEHAVNPGVHGHLVHAIEQVGQVVGRSGHGIEGHECHQACQQ